MRIVVASSGLDIAASFASCENFNYYTTQSYEIIASQNIPAQGLSAEEYAALMEKMEVDAIICDGMSAMARDAFEAHCIKVYEGKQGNALQAAQELVSSLAEELDHGNDGFDDEDFE